jgi:plastocyanin
MTASRYNFGGAWRWLAIAAALALTVLALLGLSSELASAGSAARLQRAPETVRIANFEFHPGTLTISRGTKVKFHNASGTAHTATRKGSFNTGRIAPGTSITIRFNHAGTFAYHCSIHPFMHGKIVVQ